MKHGPHIALAVGYLLRRRRRLTTALALGAAAAVGRASSSPGGLLQRDAAALGSSPELGNLAGLGGPLTRAGKAAARTAVSSRIDSMSDRLRKHGEALRQPVRPEQGRPGEDGPGEEEDVQRPRRSTRAEEPDEDEFEEPYEEDEEAGPTSTRTPRPRQTTGTRGAGRRGSRLRDLRGGTRRGRAGGPRSPARPALAGALIESGHPPKREVIT